jgi:nucleotide-binding universal stress UspA family protein
VKPRGRYTDQLAVATTRRKANTPSRDSALRLASAGARGRTILVPVDLPDLEPAALDYAWLMAKRMKASVLLLHVVERSYTGGLRDTWASQSSEKAVRREALHKLSRFAAVAKLKGNSSLSIKCLVREGIPQYEILRWAQEHKISLIILGRHSRGPLRRMIFGSTTGPVVDYAPCPVVVVPEKAGLPETW